jgi:hypothetical protein
MSYIGKVELKASDVKRDSGTIPAPPALPALNNTATLNFTAANSNSLLFYLNGVKQSTSLYTIGGSPTVITLAAGTFTEADTWEAIGINDIGTLIAPADGSVTLPKISAGTGTVGQYLKTDGVSTLSWGTVASEAPDLTTEGDMYKNYKEFTADFTTPVDSDSNQFLLGPIGVSAVGSVTWTIEGDVDIL